MNDIRNNGALIHQLPHTVVFGLIGAGVGAKAGNARLGLAAGAVFGLADGTLQKNSRTSHAHLANGLMMGYFGGLIAGVTLAKSPLGLLGALAAGTVVGGVSGYGHQFAPGVASNHRH